MTWGPGLGTRVYLPDANVDRALYQLDPALGGASSVDGFDVVPWRTWGPMVKLHGENIETWLCLNIHGYGSIPINTIFRG